MTEHRILVLSDSHGNTRNLREILARQVQKPHIILFLGDGLRDLGYLDTEADRISVFAVKGNCDYYFTPVPNEPEERLLTVGNVTICMMHGHTHNVKSDWHPAAAHAAKKGADVLLFGHTHQRMEKRLPAGKLLGGVPLEKPLTVLNPGTAGGGWGQEASFATLTVRDGKLLCAHGTLS